MFKKASLISVLAIASTTTLSAAFLNPVSASAVTFNAANDFSATNNPTGAWSYGYETTLGGAFNLYPDTEVSSSLNIWLNNSTPATTSSAQYNGTSNVVAGLQPGHLGFHPGSTGQYGILRWTAPSGGSYSLATIFSPANSSATTDVHVLQNGTSLFNGAVNGTGTSQNFSTTLSVAAGDKIDFAVGYGSNGNYISDLTGLDAVITSTNTPAVPEPSTIAGAVLGLVGLASLKVGRRSK